MNGRIAIVAALARELDPLVRTWKREPSADGVIVYSSEKAVAVFAGMGAARAEIAANAALSFGAASKMVSVGWAGGLQESMTTGRVLCICKVIDAASGEVVQTSSANGTQCGSDTNAVLITVDQVVSFAQKRLLRQKYSADLVDMEASAVARVAMEKGIPFAAIKAVSDEYDFDLPGMERFIAPNGQFRERSFIAYVALRPGLWKLVVKMARASSVAAKNLCAELNKYLAEDGGPSKAYDMR